MRSHVIEDNYLTNEINDLVRDYFHKLFHILESDTINPVRMTKDLSSMKLLFSLFVFSTFK